MKISAISDVHVKKPHDEADKLLCAFLDHSLVTESQYIALLGDIFDLMCGPHAPYLKDYQHIFERLEKLRSQGKKIIYVEGNHDVHLDKLFLKYWPGREIAPTQSPVIEKIDGKIYYFSHGDEHEISNQSYQRYISFIRTPPLRFVANYLMPYRVLKFVGERASKTSRKKGSRQFNEEKVKTTFREGVQTTTEGRYDFVLGGHSHVKDLFELVPQKHFYINNGYALKSRTFIHINNHQPSFVSL